MTPAVVVLCAWLLFGGTHLLLAQPPLRGRLVGRVGERGFAVVYTAVAALTLTLLAAAVARFGRDGAPGLALASLPSARWALGLMAYLGAALALAGLANYLRSPIAFLRRSRSSAVTLPEPAPVERITRHPFFVGTALVMGAHALLAATLAGMVFFAGFVVLALAGMPLQDRKLRARHGDVYAGYMAATSALPFGAARAASAKPSRPPWRSLALPVAGAALVVALHPLWRLGNGAPFALLIVVFGLYAVMRQFRLAAVRR